MYIRQEKDVCDDGAAGLGQAKDFSLCCTPLSYQVVESIGTQLEVRN